MGEGRLPVTRADTLAADPNTLATEAPGIFAGGDAVSGPATAIKAIAAGKRAAESIHRYLQGEELAFSAERLPVVAFADVDVQRAKKQARAAMPKQSHDARIADFVEVERGLTQEQAVEIRILARQGESIRQISRRMGLSRSTVRRYLRDESARRYGPRALGPCKLDSYIDNLQQRIAHARPDWIPATVLNM